MKEPALNLQKELARLTSINQRQQREIKTLKLMRRPQKGLPRFRYENAFEEARDAAKSVRRWWWEFLRLSKDYWMLCHTSSTNKPRTTDPDLARVYLAFGNIYKTEFEDWWANKGSSIFHEELDPPKVSLITSADFKFHKAESDKLLLEVPTNITKQTVQRQIRALLNQHSFPSKLERLELSQASFPINAVRYRLETLQKMHEVWTLHRELIIKPAALDWELKRGQTKADLFRIGKLLNLSYAYARPTDDIETLHSNQRKMRVIVSRYLNRANLLINQVERGRFPVFKPIDLAAPRFNKTQLAEHRKLEEKWLNFNLNSKLSKLNSEDVRRISYSAYLF